MNNKKLMGLIIIIAIVIVNLGVVSASGDNSTFCGVSDGGNTISVENKTFDAIENAALNSNEDDIIELEGTYLSNGSGISIYHSMTITGTGNGAVLDFENKDVNIMCRQGNITIKNINFINGNASYYGCINVNINTQLNIINCSFESSCGSPGVIYSTGYLTVTDSYFADDEYVYALIDAKDAVVKNTKFENITDTYAYGSICTQFGSMSLENCEFINSKLIARQTSTIRNCSFYQGRAGLSGEVSSSKFHNVIGSYNNMGTMRDCRFVNSSLQTLGDHVTIINSTFGDYDDYVIFICSNAVNITDCSFRDSKGAICISEYSHENNAANHITVSNSRFESLSENALSVPIHTKYSTASPPVPVNYLSVENCRFKNMKGGILWSADNVRIYNSSFENLSNDGIFLYGDNPCIDRCVFNNVTLDYYAAGAVYLNEYRSSNYGRISNTIFTNITGKAMSSDIKRIDVVNCTIHNSSSITILGGANLINCSMSNSRGMTIIDYDGSVNEINVINCSFTNNTESNLQHVLEIGAFNQSSVINSRFINNTNNALASLSRDFKVINSTFIDNCGPYESILNHYGDTLTVDRSEFIRNVAIFSTVHARKYATFTDNLFMENEAGKASCIILGYSKWQIDNCSFINNTSPTNRNVEGCEELEISQIGSYYGDVTLKVRIIDKLTGSPLANEEIIISENSVLYDKNTRYKEDRALLNDFITSNDGTVTIKLNSLNAGKYDPIIIIHPEYGTYGTCTVKIQKAPIQIVAKPLTTTYNANGHYSVKIINSKTKKAVPGIEVTVKTASKTLKAFTDKNGQAKFSLSKFSIGKNKVTIKVQDSNAVSKTLTTSIKINKAKTIVSAPKVTNKLKKSKYFKVTVKTANKKALKNTYVKIKIDSKTYKIKTDSKGVAQYDTKSLKIGKHKVTVSSGDSKYVMSAKSTIVIKR